jgi:HEAT repeat protein
MMDTEEALAFLSRHQPLPPDAGWTDELAERYAEVRDYFAHSPDPRCIPLLLNSFGQGSGFGNYQLVEDVMAQFPADLVVPNLVEALRHGTPSVRYWCAQIAAYFPESRLVGPLRDLLMTGDEDSQLAAVTALERIPDERVDDVFRQALRRELSNEAREFIVDALEIRRGQIEFDCRS